MALKERSNPQTNDNMSDLAKSFIPDRYNLLVEWAHKHLDFQRSELESVLDMYGISLDSPGCVALNLPSAAKNENHHKAKAQMPRLIQRSKV